MYYSKSNLLSYNCIFNMTIGMRGGGKTYDAKYWCITDFVNNGKQFVWTRRYETELSGADGNDGCIKSFFADICSDIRLTKKYPNLKLETKGHKAYINDKLAGYFIPLSTAHTRKSNSFPLVNKIIFDEFLIDTATYHYLKNEVRQLLDLYETIDRKRDEVICWLIGNALSFANPYMLYWKIKPFNKKYYVNHDLSVVCEMYYCEEFAQSKANTRFGKSIANTDYGNYAIGNKFILDSNTFIETKPPQALFRCALMYQGVTYGFWVDWQNGRMFTTRQYDKDSHRIYCLSKDDHNVNLLLVKNLKGTLLEEVLFCYQNAILCFTDIIVKSKVLEALSFFVR